MTGAARAALCAALLPWGPGAAAASECRLALALALDVSRSVDTREHALQRGGLIAALSAPEVRRAFFAAPLPVALAVYEWSGPAEQHLLLDWVLIRAPGDLDRVADRIGQAPRNGTEAPTAMGQALLYGAALMARERTDTPAVLRRNVTSPGGTTQAAIDALNEVDGQGLIARAIGRARARSESLAEEFGRP